MNKFLKCPVEHFQIPLDAANVTTGLLVDFDIGEVESRVTTRYYVKTAASAGALLDIGQVAVAEGAVGARATNFLDGGSAVTGAVGGLGETIDIKSFIVPAHYHITVYNVITSTGNLTIATGIVGYLDLEITRFPVRVGDQ